MHDTTKIPGTVRPSPVSVLVQQTTFDTFDLTRVSCVQLVNGLANERARILMFVIPVKKGKIRTVKHSICFVTERELFYRSLLLKKHCRQLNLKHVLVV